MSKRPASDALDADAEMMPPPSVGASSSRASPVYLPCKTFQGARRGYFFKLGGQGPGYYIDQVARDAATAMMPPPKRRKNAQELLAEAEQEAGFASGSGQNPDGREFADASTVLDDKQLKKLVLTFERRYSNNQQARLKHPSNPEKFVDSEVDLDEALRALSGLAGYPELYPEFCRLNTVPSILGLLAHDNPDVASHALELLHELTDSDSIESNEAGGKTLIHSIAKESGYELLLNSLTRFTKNEMTSVEDASAVHHGLGLVENALEIDPDQVHEMCLVNDGALIIWILKRATKSGGKKKTTSDDSDSVDDVRSYAAEVLAILCQSDGDEVKRLVNTSNGIDFMLRSVAPYKSKDPQNESSLEWLENIFDSLCACLALVENRDRFVENEGLELMLLLMRSKKECRIGAIKTIDHALTNHKQANKKFIDVLGLKTVFAAFMGKGKKKKDGDEQSSERAVSVIASLFANLDPDDARHSRLCSKFVEDEFAKCDRLCELWSLYAAKVARLDAKLAHDTRTGGVLDGADSDELYVERLGGGLYNLELLGCIIGSVFATKHDGIQQRLLLQLELGSENGDGDGEGEERLTRPVRDVLETHAENIGDLDGEEEQMRRRMRVVKLIVALGGGREEALDE
ncbi:beta-catenin-like protein 1 [bacterium]|nr:beta-catenin-like protein 1 [bacterium]